MGSGKLIVRAIKKYGIENFKKEILHVFDNEIDMNNKEKEIVTEEYCKRKDTYNLCPGGHGGFGYINANFTAEDKQTAKACASHAHKLKTDKNYRNKWKNTLLSVMSTVEYKNNVKAGVAKYYENNSGSFFGKKHKKVSIKKISESMQGKQTGIKNSQYGTCWITNNMTNKKIMKNDLQKYENLGWRKGRKY